MILWLSRSLVNLSCLSSTTIIHLLHSLGVQELCLTKKRSKKVWKISKKTRIAQNKWNRSSILHLSHINEKLKVKQTIRMQVLMLEYFKQMLNFVKASLISKSNFLYETRAHHIALPLTTETCHKETWMTTKTIRSLKVDKSDLTFRSLLFQVWRTKLNLPKLQVNTL